MDRSERFWSKVDTSGDCWIWHGTVLADGYGQFGATGERRAHRVAWELTNGPIPAALWVLHNCDRPLCVRPDHLYLGTPKDNARDRETRGRASPIPARYLAEHGRRAQPGEAHHGAKLTREQVEEIRSSYQPNPRHLPGGVTQRMLATRFGVDQPTISSIVRGRTWGERTGVRVSPHEPTSLLTADQVAEIRRRYSAGGVSQQSLADEFGVHQTTVSRIVIHA